MSRLYKTYLFKDKDPAIDLLRTIVKDTGMSYKEIAEKSGVAYYTLSKWFYGDTKRPQHATIVAVARALGYDYKLVRSEPKMNARPLRLVHDNGAKKLKGKSNV